MPPPNIPPSNISPPGIPQSNIPPPGIQWFPGHMHKARKEIAKRLAQLDLLVEVLDARLPFSSENPMLDELRAGKPCIKLLNKSDLADAESTDEWLSYFKRLEGTTSLSVCGKDSDSITAISTAIKDRFPGKLQSLKGIQVMIAGIPNVGKSTLINLLAGRAIAKTGNEPAVTKLQQRIDLGNGIVLFDTPGVLWPNVENRNSGFRLAASGAIKDTAMEYEDVALFLLDYLKIHYPAALQSRYQLEQIEQTDKILDGGDSVAVLDAIGRMRGCLRRGGGVDWQRAAKIVVNDLRSQALGRITLESPTMMHTERAELALIRAEKQARDQARERARDDARKNRQKNKRRR